MSSKTGLHDFENIKTVAVPRTITMVVHLSKP